MVSAIAAPGIPNGLLYGLSILGCFTRSIMNARHCMAYAMTAPNTAMERIVLPNAASGPPEKNMVNKIKNPTTPPDNSATWGVFLFSPVTDSHLGK